MPHRDAALVMLTTEAQLPILGNICAKFEQNLISSYREKQEEKLFVNMFSYISAADTALVMLI